MAEMTNREVAGIIRDYLDIWENFTGELDDDGQDGWPLDALHPSTVQPYQFDGMDADDVALIETDGLLRSLAWNIASRSQSA